MPITVSSIVKNLKNAQYACHFVARKNENTECHNPGKRCFPPKQEQVYSVLEKFVIYR